LLASSGIIYQLEALKQLERLIFLLGDGRQGVSQKDGRHPVEDEAYRKTRTGTAAAIVARYFMLRSSATKHRLEDILDGHILARPLEIEADLSCGRLASLDGQFVITTDMRLDPGKAELR